MGVIRKTKSVKRLLSVFEQTDSAISVVELVKMFKNEMNKTTVYRILDRLKDEGVLHSFTGSNGLKWFAKCKDSENSSHANSHLHFQCQECGKSECLDLHINIPDLPKHKVYSTNLLLVGQCKNCL